MQVFSPEALKAARKAGGFTQKALGEAVGTTEQHVQLWEYGKRTPTADYLLRILVLLGCAPQDLLKDPDPQG